MLVGIIRFWKGFVVFHARGKSPERLLNWCARNGVRLWDARPTEEGLSARVAAGDYRLLRTGARKAGVTLRLQKKRGTPFIVRKYRSRMGLTVGAGLGAALLILLSQFIWTVNISELHGVSEQRLRELLAESGVSAGALRHGVDTSQARRDILLQIEEIGWLSVNICGCHADVEVKEKIPKPPLEEDTSPCNIKAAADGVVTKITAAQGIAQVKPGSGVRQGDLLISGVSMTRQNTVRTLRAKGEVMADVISSKELYLPKTYQYQVLTGENSARRQLYFLGARLPCSVSLLSFPDAAYTEDTVYAEGNGTALPLGITTQTAWELKGERVSLSKEQAEGVFRKALLLYELFEQGDGTRVKKETSVTVGKDGYHCAARYVFNRNIAESVDFSVAE